jgi:ADP-ribose 1''-phosphate phosphatase
MGLQYKRGNVFNYVTPDQVLVHACNAQGVWVPGTNCYVKAMYPFAFKQYRHWCKIYKGNVAGKCLLVSDNFQAVGNLVTSSGYGESVDDVRTILRNTYKSVRSLLEQLPILKPVVSSKINCSLFAVPWHLTEKAIMEAIEDSGEIDVTWIVYEG